MMMKPNRRQFTTMGVASLALGGLLERVNAAEVPTYRNTSDRLGPLRRDPQGLLDLPHGFTYRIIAREGERMADGFFVPGKFDGMASFILDKRRIALVRNHEIDPSDWHLGAARDDAALGEKLRALPHYGKDKEGRVMPGGTSTMIVDWRKGVVERQYLSLSGTTYNCSGGITPWGSWLSCEETVLQTDMVEKSHGWVFEVPARQSGLVTPVPLTGLGRFRHEAATVDPATGIVYLTEDQEDGLLYRFLPDTPGVLAEGGRLQALAVMEPPTGNDFRNWGEALVKPGKDFAVRWIDMEETHNPLDDMRVRGHAKGATLFARGEGIHAARNRRGQTELYFTCTSGGAAKIGQIMRLTPGKRDESARLRLFLESESSLLLDYADNITVAPWGDLIMCEDRAHEGTNHIRGIRPDGSIYTVARLNAPTEFAGGCFTPDGRSLFVNLQDPGRTVMISGF